jgi:transposase
MSRPIQTLPVTEDQKRELERIVKSPTSPQRDASRARIVLLKAQGVSQREIASEVGVRRRIVGKWCRRFSESGIAGLQDAKGRGRKPSVPEATQSRVAAEAVRPPPGRARWSLRGMARHAGVSHDTVRRLWAANDIKPHLMRTFKASSDPHFEGKFWDVIGLYLNPPEKALVLCCDEKSQCQALERSQPGLPLGVGHVRTRTHDYTRHGTVTLFAALSYLDGKIFRRTDKRHTHSEWLAFLRQIDRDTPKDLDLHLILDNYCTRKEASVKRWLSRRPRFHLHFTPTSSSWMNLVERFFRDISEDVVREGSFTGARELADAMESYIDERNLAPRRYVWRQSGAAILEKISRARAKLEQVKSEEKQGNAL